MSVRIKESVVGNYVVVEFSDEICLFECNDMAHPTWIATLYNPEMEKQKGLSKTEGWKYGLRMAVLLSSEEKNSRTLELIYRMDNRNILK